ncbi:PREDICTED: uncharacterized protein LOC109361876 [Lupinus angustifolius]|uniref:uncharacterized protein LOC109361876 n=1 Tax=Lupinus angustifolius TaxID=3871 RepID=UPI00092EEBFE|nr:PREDICTED: uncharacterized protein LOC109361876 [Lupinus angustifolius]
MNDFKGCSILSWNIRGAINKDGRQHARYLVRMFKPLIIVLMKTHYQFSRAEYLWNSLGYVKSGIVEAVGHARGIWVLLAMDNVLCTIVVNSCNQAISLKLQCSSKEWIFSAIYASSSSRDCELLWDYLLSFHSSVQLPWLLLGDFNEVFLSSEVRGDFFNHSHAHRFSQVLERCGLMDIGAIGSQFTWFRREVIGCSIAKKLDRGLCDNAWGIAFPRGMSRILFSCIQIIVPCWFGVVAILMAFAIDPSVRCGGHNVVHEAWLKGNVDVVEGLHRVREDAIQFNNNTFGNIFQRKRRVKARIRGVQLRLLDFVDRHLVRLDIQLRREYNNILKQKELLWFLKSREQWVKFGDRNTKFFHTQTIIRRKRNNIHGLFLEDGSWCTDLEPLRREVQLDQCVVDIPRLSIVGVEALRTSVTMKEVTHVVMSIQSFKAPGSDGFHPIIFKKYWQLMGDDIWRLVSDAFKFGFSDSRIVETLLVLIPKVNNPTSLKDLHPISLYNVVYKLIMKVLVGRMRPFLHDLVGPLQSSFIPGRGTTDNIVLA